MSLGHSPNVEPYKPDMKKADSDITAAEKEEARRRIEGSLAADRKGVRNPLGIAGAQ